MGKNKKRTKKIRLLVQCAFAALSNGNLMGFQKGKIYSGSFKVLCHPGLNCYSCPGALTSCPIGALQAVLNSKQYHVALYVLGFFTVFGAFFGRLICGFLCPFGLVQDLLYKIPLKKKVRKLRGERYLRIFRFVVLFAFVIFLPTVVHNSFGMGNPWFCQYICPQGTLEAGIPLAVLNPELQSAIGWTFIWKVVVFVGILILSVVLFRPFCRYLCPLGAVYGLFNRFALYRYEIVREKCIKCGACQSACHLDIPVWEKPNSIDCIRCGECKSACPTAAVRISRPLSFGAGKGRNESPK